MRGRTLAHYEIVELLGAGGMGEVYRAHDTTLKRDVAIKVLPADLSEDPERLARLQREAHLLASLNHSHIASIYSLEEADGVRFLVLELVEGDTLAERLVGSELGGRLEVEEALEFARQIAAALEAAHNKGIIHRDLKPANIKITPDDQVKVLDFGLAKVYVEEAPVSEASPDLTKSPTMADATKAGMLLGTAAYMSPEQARVKPLDKRTDVWSFGCVLHEMLTGRRPFEGSTISDTLAAILRGEPDWDALPPETPTSVRTLLRRCMAKDIKLRMHDMGDVWLELEEAPEQAALEREALERAAREGTGLELGVRAPVPPWQRALPWAVAAISLVLVTWLATRPQPPAAALRAGRFVLHTEPLALGAEPFSSLVELSRDGTMMAYVAGGDTLGQIYLRRFDSFESMAVEGAERARLPFFSPDGEWLGFESEGELWKVPVAGGKAWPICAAAFVNGVTWLDDGTIIYGDAMSYELRRVSAEGGQPETILRGEPDQSQSDAWAVYPEALPGGEDIVFTVVDGAGVAQRVELLSIDTGVRKILFQGGSNTRYLSTGHLAYALDGSLMVVPFDADRGEITGSPVPVLDGLLMGFPWNSNFAHFSVADDGMLAYVSGPPLATTVSLQRVDRNGTATQIGDELDRAQGPRFSLDGRRIIVSSQSRGDVPTLWIHDLERDTFTRLDLDLGAYWPQWTPDGRSVTFQATPSDVFSTIMMVLTDGSGSPERLVQNVYPQQANDWLPDGKTLILQQIDHPDTKWDVMRLRPGVDAEAIPILNSPFMELLAEVSPDGKWIAYTSDESGQFEVYVRSFPDLGSKWQISTAGGIEPAWSPDGTELFYRNEHGSRLMVVDVSLEPGFQPGRPRLLFEGNFVQTPWYGRNYDVAPDGESFVMVQQNLEGFEEARLHVVLNWSEEVRQSVPSER